MKPVCIIAKDAPDMAICFAIRSEVFIIEQFVPEEREFDEHDAHSVHFLVRANGAPVGTGRLRYLNGKAKIERVAVRKPHRNKGYGRAVMETMLTHIRRDAKTGKVVLSAQLEAIPFYTSLKFTTVGDEYMDAGIPHKDMELAL